VVWVSKKQRAQTIENMKHKKRKRRLKKLTLPNVIHIHKIQVIQSDRKTKIFSGVWNKIKNVCFRLFHIMEILLFGFHVLHLTQLM
jgi:hypothetical protein